MSAKDYSNITIIYNPNSTSGRAERRAKLLVSRLESQGYRDAILQATEHAGHAKTLAYEIACAHAHPLIVSVSGDGGYNEVINGVMQAKDEGKAKQPVCALIAAGNANDHRRSTRKYNLAAAIKDAKPEPVDILLLQTSGTSKPIKRYAHSYIGFGITSNVAVELNRESLSPIKETKIVLRNIFRFKSFLIERPDKTTRRLNSLVFANIHQMAKVLKLGGKTDLHDGQFRIIAIPHRNPLRLLYTYISIATRGYKSPPQTDAYKFTLKSDQVAHTDGEIFTIPSKSHVTVTSAKEALLVLR